ncbi:hypothetical protein [Sedimenticola sp.]|uniref:hypothetical protein n=1 Tax=Sedimenticola sp. TaxID=1940285 RepID=UPI00258D21D9|nr:hypothetical protein [Sedimenticola sp.]MCW8903352.1 hypothetical protein [Sedimenticola sp.]
MNNIALSIVRLADNRTGDNVNPRSIAGTSLGLAYLLLATPMARGWLEMTMSSHMLVQIPLLVAIGFLAIRVLPKARQTALLTAVGGTLPCVLLAVIASTYWMLPRALDAALASSSVELAKFVTLPALVGAPLSLAWQRLAIIGRGVIWTNFISMLAVLGWLYIVAPVRVCNNYSVFEQERAGWLMVVLAVSLFFAWLCRLFVGSAPIRQTTDSCRESDVMTAEVAVVSQQA